MNILFGIFIAGTFIQFVFYLLVFIRLSRYRLYEDPLNFSDQPVSIIICARNEIENLKNLIPKLEKQAHANFEVIVVNDRSDDGTFEYLRETKQNFPNLKIVTVDFVPEHVNPKKYAITLGVKAAENDILLLTDADCEPATIHWVKKMESQFSRDSRFVLGFSYYRKGKGLLNRFIRYETIQTGLQYLSAAIGGRPYMGVGRNMGYRKSFFLDNKGFFGNLKVMGGDDDLLVNKFATKSNTRIALSPDALTVSIPKKSVKDYYLQKLRHLSVGKRYRTKDKLIAMLFFSSKIVFWLSAIFLVITNAHIRVTLGLILAMVVSMYLALAKLAGRSGIRFEYGWVVPSDILYALYLMIMGPWALLSKKIKWN